VAGRQLLTILLEAAGVDAPERVLRAGRVAIGGRRVREVRARADPLHDTITLDGRPLDLTFCRYVRFYKPYGVMSHFTDREGRATLADYVPLPGVYAAGRLDWDSEGLLLLTDDGWLIHRLTDPRFEHPRVYLVQVERVPDGEALADLRTGITIGDYRTRPAEAALLPAAPELPPRPVPIRERKSVPTAWLRLVLYEGRKRQVRRMTAAVGHPTLRLVRAAIGPLTLARLSPGQWQELTPAELQALQTMIGVGSR
jgi:23S rRNA pseudouridine2457 synthase